jgi:ABC-type dipeptide/oligopeptide/nickel transport system ATPase subunit
MTTIAIFVTIISSLLSGLIGIFVSFYFFNRLEKRKLKVETARKMFANKHDIKSKEFKEAMNEVMVVFSDSTEVITAMEELWQTLQTPIDSRPQGAADEKLVKLMKSMCREIGIEHKKLSDAYYLRYFST